MTETVKQIKKETPTLPKDICLAALKFLDRAQLTGAEAEYMVNVKQALTQYLKDVHPS